MTQKEALSGVCWRYSVAGWPRTRKVSRRALCRVHVVRQVVHQVSRQVVRAVRHTSNSAVRQSSKMARLRQIAVLGLLLTTMLVTAAPLFACMLPRSSANQHGCCPKSQATLEQSRVPNTTTCCEASRVQRPQLLTREPNSSSQPAIVLLPGSDFVRPVSASLSPTLESSPPEAPPGGNAVLRI